MPHGELHLGNCMPEGHLMEVDLALSYRSCHRFEGHAVLRKM